MTASPDTIDDAEPLARRCERNKIKNGKVHWRAFACTSVPLEISHDRVDYCDPWGALTDTSRQTLAFLLTGAIRRELSNAEVRAQKPPEEHAVVAVQLEGVMGTAVETKAELEELGVWSQVVDAMMVLARLARPTLEDPGLEG